MALSLTVRLLMNIKMLKSALILKSLPKSNVPVSLLADQYMQVLKSMKNEITQLEAIELMEFPFQSFHKFPKSILKNIIDESFHLLKEQGKAKSVNIYNRAMQSYISYDINFDLKGLLNDMKENQINFDRNTYSNVIQYYCHRGEMNTLERFLKEMRSENQSLRIKDQVKIISGYIIAGEPEKSKDFMEKYKLKDSTIEMLISKARSYATIGDVKHVEYILNKIQKYKLSCSPGHYFIFYRLLIQANVPESSLEKILYLMTSVAVENTEKIYDTILLLNQNEYFNNSAYLIEQFINIIEDKQAFNLIMSFNKSNCPMDTYKNILKCLIDRVQNVHNQTNVFFYMNFDEALEFGRSIINKKNGDIICYSLINKAINAKSIISIQNALQFLIDNLELHRINLILQYTFITSIFESGIVSNYQELLDFFPKFTYSLRPVILMDNLCKGNFDEFNRLRIDFKNIENLNFITKWGFLSKEIIKHLSMRDINKLAEEARKVFSMESVNCLLSNLIINKMINASHNKSLDDLPELIKLGKV